MMITIGLLVLVAALVFEVQRTPEGRAWWRSRPRWRDGDGR